MGSGGNSMINVETRMLKKLTELTDREIVLHVLDRLTWHYSLPETLGQDVKLSDVVEKTNVVCEVRLKVREVEDILTASGFKVSYTHGIKYIRANPELLDKLT
jgi:hypothetical protein